MKKARILLTMLIEAACFRVKKATKHAADVALTKSWDQAPQPPQWRSSWAFASHAGDSGSIPGRDKSMSMKLSEIFTDITICYIQLRR